MENLLKRSTLTGKKVSQDEVKKVIQFLVLNFLGSLIYAGGIYIFAAPHQIAPGGASGLGVLVNYLCGFPLGIFTFIFNIPFLIMSYKYLSKAFIFKALISITMLSIITDYVIVYFPTYKGDPLLAAILAGTLMGVGLAIVHMSRSTTGGRYLSYWVTHAENMATI